MIPACEKRNIKLLTYGTLYGGFLAEKWFRQPEPEIFDDGFTPSHRKALEYITKKFIAETIRACFRIPV
jgi:hypothetical protein